MRLILIMAFWACATVILVLAMAPLTPILPTTGWDKGNHFLAFCVLTLLGWRAYPGRFELVLLGLIAFGGMIEALQSLTAYRSAEWADWLADIIGIGGGLAMRSSLLFVYRHHAPR